MNTDAVLTFVAVAEEGQFQLAAARLGITQQATSKRVAALEADLGIALLRRTPAGATLTRDGERFLPHAKAITDAVSAAKAAVQPQAGPLRIDVLDRKSAPFDLLRSFHEANQGLGVEVVSGGGAVATVRALLAGEIDAGYAYLRDPAAELGPQLSADYAYLEPLEVIVGAGHPLAGAGSARLADLARYPAWVPGIVAGSEWESFYHDLAAAFGLDIDPTPYAAGIGSVFHTVAASRSLLTFVGEKSRVALPASTDLLRLPVVEPVPCYPWSLIWRSQPRHPDTRRLVAHTRRAFRARHLAASWLPRQARDDLALTR
jgi:DNA-binding transcriptional LysR family regulator